MGYRLLRSNILQPSTEEAVLNLRLDAIDDIVSSSQITPRELKAQMRRMPDLEILLAKVTHEFPSKITVDV